MRLIDADALPRHGKRGGIVHWKDIENAPIIETVPVRKGKWVRDYKAIGMVWNCSECGSLEFGYAEYLSKFCDNCGVDMRGESDDQIADDR